MPDRRPRRTVVLAAALLLAVPVPPASAAGPELLGRSLLPATAFQEGPPSGAATTGANGLVPPYAAQPVPGFSALLHPDPARPGPRRLLAMPDNGFGTRANSADFLLRIYEIDADHDDGDGAGTGDGDVDVIRRIDLRDPDRLVPFPIVNGDTPERLLTGADFDVEALARDARGNLWLGDEFGPYLLQVDPTGRVLRAPVRLPGGRVSPQSPDLVPGRTPTVPSSRGLEAVAASRDGRTLYAVLEGALTSDADQRRRMVYEFDALRGRYTGRTWALRVSSPELMIADAQVIDGRRLLVVERDGRDGADARVKRLVVVNLGSLDAAGYARRRVAADLLRIADPRGVSTPARPGEYGVGPVFAFALNSVEAVLLLPGDRVVVANDNNFPADDGRIAGRPDDVELVVLHVPGLGTR